MIGLKLLMTLLIFFLIKYMPFYQGLHIHDVRACMYTLRKKITLLEMKFIKKKSFDYFCSVYYYIVILYIWILQIKSYTVKYTF